MVVLIFPSCFHYISNNVSINYQWSGANTDWETPSDWKLAGRANSMWLHPYCIHWYNSVYILKLCNYVFYYSPVEPAVIKKKKIAKHHPSAAPKQHLNELLWAVILECTLCKLFLNDVYNIFCICCALLCNTERGSRSNKFTKSSILTLPQEQLIWCIKYCWVV